MQPFHYIKNIKQKKMLYLLATAALCLIAIWFWQTHNQPAVPAAASPLVRTAVAGAAKGAACLTYAGEVRGRYESQLAFQVSGKIIKRNVQLGSTVQAGDVLFAIDPRDIEQTVTSGSAQVYSAQSQLKLAANNLQRYRQLYAQNAVSLAQLDQYENAYELAQAAVQQAVAQYSQNTNQLDYSLLRADAAGVIAGLQAEAGQVVSSGQTVVTIVRYGEREVEISIPENRLEELRQATQLSVSFWALPNVTVNGEVREIAPMATPATRTYPARIRLLNPPPAVQLGMTATVTATSPEALNTQVISVPLTAVYQTGDTPGVWVVADSAAHFRPVSIVTLGSSQAQVTGLLPGETFITAGVHKLYEGQQVRLPDGDQL